ncbi:hypothetical protein D3C77_537480 [compost metagenome]
MNARASSTASIQQLFRFRMQTIGVIAHHFSKPGDLVDRLSFDAKSRQEPTDLGMGQFAVHQHLHHTARFLPL